MPNRWAFGFLTPTVKYRSVSYELDDHTLIEDDSPEAGSLMASSMGVSFSSGRRAGGSMTQTLEPRALPLLGLRGADRSPRF